MLSEKNKYLLLLAPFFFLISCHKDSKTSGGGSTGSTQQQNTYSGILISFCTNSTPSDAAAVFYSSPQIFSFEINPPRVAVDSVFFNNANLPFASSIIEYEYLSGSFNFPPSIWKVKGMGIIPSFTFTNNDSIPKFTGLSQFPDSVKKSQNLVVNLTGLSYWDEMIVNISDNAGNQTFQTAYAGSTTITFKKDSLAKLTTTSGNISIDVIKLNGQTFGGKNFLFANDNEFGKAILLKP